VKKECRDLKNPCNFPVDYDTINLTGPIFLQGAIALLDSNHQPVSMTPRI